jgi:septal ring factor EnvC (AmiA/AmiB activator)
MNDVLAELNKTEDDLFTSAKEQAIELEKIRTTVYACHEYLSARLAEHLATLSDERVKALYQYINDVLASDRHALDIHKKNIAHIERSRLEIRDLRRTLLLVKPDAITRHVIPTPLKGRRRLKK